VNGCGLIDPSLLATNAHMFLKFGDSLLHRDVYQVVSHAMAHSPSLATATAQDGKCESVDSLWRHTLCPLLGMSRHHCYCAPRSGNKPSGDHVDDGDVLYSPDARVLTTFGEGVIVSHDAERAMYKVQLSFGMGFLGSDAILFSLPKPDTDALSPNDLVGTSLAGLDWPTEEKDTAPARGGGGYEKISKVVYGPLSLYIYCRLHHAIYNRLAQAKRLCLETTRNRESVHANALQIATQSSSDYTCPMESDTMTEEEGHGMVARYGHDSYEAFIHLLCGAVDGTVDSSKFDESSRLLLGSRGYVCFTLDKVVISAAKQIALLVSDGIFYKLQAFGYLQSVSIQRKQSGSPQSAESDATLRAEAQGSGGTDVVQLMKNLDYDSDIYGFQMSGDGSFAPHMVAIELLGNMQTYIPPSPPRPSTTRASAARSNSTGSLPKLETLSEQGEVERNDEVVGAAAAGHDTAQSKDKAMEVPVKVEQDATDGAVKDDVMTVAQASGGGDGTGFLPNKRSESQMSEGTELASTSEKEVAQGDHHQTAPPRKRPKVE